MVSSPLEGGEGRGGYDHICKCVALLAKRGTTQNTVPNPRFPTTQILTVPDLTAPYLTLTLTAPDSDLNPKPKSKPVALPPRRVEEEPPIRVHHERVYRRHLHFDAARPSHGLHSYGWGGEERRRGGGRAQVQKDRALRDAGRCAHASEGGRGERGERENIGMGKMQGSRVVEMGRDGRGCGVMRCSR